MKVKAMEVREEMKKFEWTCAGKLEIRNIAGR
jgi:hypothetical protein